MPSPSSVRDSVKDLSPGSTDHYSAFVGPPDQYDFMGASQFRLLCTLGLRENHRLLDFGCGSLRAGRLFIPYLAKNRYFGVDPNKWLIDEAIKNEIGESLVEIKRCAFDYNDNFDCSVFGVNFDFIVAQSIFSHAGRSQIKRSFDGFYRNLNEEGIVAATFVIPKDKEIENLGDEWVYPGCVFYSEETIAKFSAESSLEYVKIPWHHPRQSWFLFSKNARNLPDTETATRYLQGNTLKNQPVA